MSNGPNPTGEERGSSKCNRIHSKQVAVICIVVTVILTLVFLDLIIASAAVRTFLTQPQGSITCIPCEKMKYNNNTKPSPEPAGRSAIKQRDDEMCCGPVESIIQILFQTEMTSQYHYGSSGQSIIDIAEEYAAYKRVTHDKQPIAKAVGIVEFKPSYMANGHHTAVKNKDGGTFNKNKFNHLELEGKIFDRQPGYYIVSSQLNLRPRKGQHTPLNETSLTTFIHHVDLLSDHGKTGVLMESQKSTEGNCGYFTSFQSAVFKLNKYDRLSVSVSNPELLDIGNSNDYFLVYYTYDLPY